jgi:hypothetical protein
VDYNSLEFHPLAKVDRMMTEDERALIMSNIAKDGIWETHKIILFEGKIIAGRNRYQCGKAVGYKFTAKDFHTLPGMTPAQAKEWVWKESNRRHDTTADKQAKLKAALLDFPTYNDKKIGMLCGVDRKTAKAARERMKPQDDKKLEKLCDDWEDLDTALQRKFVAKYIGEIRDLM